MRTHPRLIALALAPGLVALLIAAVALTAYAHEPDGSVCPGRVYKAAWHPDELVFSGERAPGEAERRRAACRKGARATARNAREAAAIGAGLLVIASVGIAASSRRAGGEGAAG